MYSKSKADIANQLDKLSPLEAISGMAKSLQLGDQEQADKIFWRLPKEQRIQAWHIINLGQRKFATMQTILLLKASMAVHFYEVLLDNLLGGKFESVQQDYDASIEKQRNYEKEIERIDLESKGVLKLPEIEEAHQGMCDYYGQWKTFVAKFASKDVDSEQK